MESVQEKHRIGRSNTPERDLAVGESRAGQRGGRKKSSVEKVHFESRIEERNQSSNGLSGAVVSKLLLSPDGSVC